MTHSKNQYGANHRGPRKTERVPTLLTVPDLRVSPPVLVPSTHAVPDVDQVSATPDDALGFAMPSMEDLMEAATAPSGSELSEIDSDPLSDTTAADKDALPTTKSKLYEQWFAGDWRLDMGTLGTILATVVACALVAQAMRPTPTRDTFAGAPFRETVEAGTPGEDAPSESSGGSLAQAADSSVGEQAQATFDAGTRDVAASPSAIAGQQLPAQPSPFAHPVAAMPARADALRTNVALRTSDAMPASGFAGTGPQAPQASWRQPTSYAQQPSSPAGQVTAHQVPSTTQASPLVQQQAAFRAAPSSVMAGPLASGGHAAAFPQAVPQLTPQNDANVASGPSWPEPPAPATPAQAVPPMSTGAPGYAGGAAPMQYPNTGSQPIPAVSTPQSQAFGGADGRIGVADLRGHQTMQPFGNEVARPGNTNHYSAGAVR